MLLLGQVNGLTASHPDLHHRRCMSMLGFDEYIESQTDGLQILRYNLTTAYTPHMDYLEDKGYTQAYDYESDGRGGNRFATILLYFSDLEDNQGGETVFPRAWPVGASQLSKDEEIRLLREAGDAKSLTEGSWEEEMSAQCRTRFSVKPRISRAVLFYSQYPNGALDQKSFHGGCPVLGGTKWAANLWAWNAPRPEYDGAPLREGTTVEQVHKDPTKLHATFMNTGKDKRFDKAEKFTDFRKMLDNATDDAQRKVLLAGKVEDMINTVVRQIAFYDFECKLHEARRGGELTPDDINALWMSVQAESPMHCRNW